MLAQHRALDVVSRFLDNACPDHHVRGGMDHRRAQYAAMRMLERDPGIAHASFYAAVVCGDLDAVTRALDADPSLAVRASGGADPARAGGGGENDLLKRDWGPKGWEPLLYLCFTRLPLPAVNHNSVAIAKLLLDKGANPNAYFMAGNSRYTPLVGVIGEGEEGRPAHSQRDALVRLLLERGADPHDEQVAYNTHFKNVVVEPWHPLWAAARHNQREAAEQLLDLGVSPDVESPEGERALHIAAYSDSLDVARLLVERGAEIDPIGRQYQNTPLGGAMHCQSWRIVDFLSGISRSAWEVGYAGNVAHLRELLDEKPERARGYDGETLLMYLPVDDEAKAMEVAELLLANGADPSLRDPNGATAADRADRNGMYAVAERLRAAERG